MSLRARIERIERRRPPQGEIKKLSDLELATALWLVSKLSLDHTDSTDETRASSLSKMQEIEARHQLAALEQASERVKPFIQRQLEKA